MPRRANVAECHSVANSMAIKVALRRMGGSVSTEEILPLLRNAAAVWR